MLNAHCFIKDHFVPFALSYRLVWVNLDPPKEPTEPLGYIDSIQKGTERTRSGPFGSVCMLFSELQTLIRRTRIVPGIHFEKHCKQRLHVHR